MKNTLYRIRYFFASGTFQMMLSLIWNSLVLVVCGLIMWLQRKCRWNRRG